MKFENSKLSIRVCKSDIEWDNFINKSENKNFLCLAKIINSSKCSAKKYFIYKANEIIASFHLYLEKNKIVSGDQIYTPICYKFNNNANQSSASYNKFLINEKYINFIFENFDNGEITFDYFMEDLRPFLWLNFNSIKEKLRITDVKYTTVLNLSNLNKNISFNNFEDSDLYKSFSRSIKQQYKISKKDNFEIEESNNFKYANLILEKTFERQKKNNQINLSTYEKNYDNFKKDNQIKLFYCLKKNKIISFTLFGIIDDSAKYLHGGRLIDDNKDNSLTFNMLSSIIKLKRSDVNILDLEGINSPNRGFWKIGFGGKMKPYYKIKF